MIFFPENLLLWQPYNAFSCSPKIESYCIIKITGRRNLLKLLYYMLSGMIFTTCRADERKKATFPLLLFYFFPTHRIVKKIGIDTHPIDLSCHQKFEKKFTNQKQKYWRTKLEIWKKSQSTRSNFTRAQSCSRAQWSSHTCKTTGIPSRYFSSFYRLQEK